MRIGVIGTGYVGLVTAVCLAELDHHVIGTDVVREKIDLALAGRPHIYEPGLEELLKKNLKEGRLTFYHDLDKTIKDSDVLFVCVSTPQRPDGRADMTYVEGVSRRIAENLNTYKLIVEKSTVPVRTSAWIKRVINLYRRNAEPFDVASNPEFLREGSAVEDFLHPDRIIIGVESAKAERILRQIYARFADKILVTNIDTAELIKHASNSFLAMKISFINLISELCEKTEADVELVARGMGLDPRIGPQFLRAGLGYGGSCFPKDVRALIHIGEEMGVDFGLLKEVDKINTRRIEIFINKIKQALWILREKKIALLGLSFKPHTDDIRNAPSIAVIRELQKEGAFLRLYDPQAMNNMKEVFPEKEPELVYCQSPYQALEGANAGLIITEWPEFQAMDLTRIKDIMSNPILIDGRNIFDPDEVRKQGIEYYSMGRK
ncbi:UDP-glucose/GDP-mannose dehydrogenase family protein [Candidatus Aminicenantes bacterium AC-334-K16]|nr:UDP-glucose/GDP-mannose dehydrogenase family protein [Candidatus Aminicenantes bacterium AC-334-K16]